MENAKITSKGQITIPAKIRQALNLEIGDNVCFMQKGEDIVLRRAKDESFETLRSSAEKLGLENMDQVGQLLEKLAVSYEQAQNGQTMDGDEFFRGLLGE